MHNNLKGTILGGSTVIELKLWRSMQTFPLTVYSTYGPDARTVTVSLALCLMGILTGILGKELDQESTALDYTPDALVYAHPINLQPALKDHLPLIPTPRSFMPGNFAHLSTAVFTTLPVQNTRATR